MKTAEEKISEAEEMLQAMRRMKGALRGIILAAEKDIEDLKHDREAAKIVLTNKQAASMLGVTLRTVQRWKQDGRLKSTSLLDVYECKWRKKESA